MTLNLMILKIIEYASTYVLKKVQIFSKNIHFFFLHKMFLKTNILLNSARS